MVAILLIAAAGPGLASAAEPPDAPSAVVGEVAARLEAGTASTPGHRLGGAAFTLGGRLPGAPIDLGGALSASGGTLGWRVDPRAQMRWWVAQPNVGPSLVFEYGVRAGAGLVEPAGGIGAAWDLALPREDAHHRLRLGGLLQVRGVQPAAGVFTVGWAWGPEPEPPPPPPPPPEPEPEANTFPDDARIWLPHPVCRWVDESELDDVLASLPPDQRAHVHAAAMATLYTDASGLDGAVMEPAPTQGALLVVGQPGDRVRVGEHEVSAGVDGVVQLAIPEGTVEAHVVGGGRETSLLVAISVGHGSWVRVPEPAPTLVDFELGRADISEASRAQLQELVELAGGWRFELQGGFSPEGNRASNIALADRRAEAVRQALIELGLPEAQVAIIPSAVPEDATDAASRRVCTIHPRPAGEDRP